MSASTIRPHLKIIVLSAALLVPVLVALGDFSRNPNGASIAWREVVPTVAPTVATTVTPEADGQGGTSQLPAVRLSTEDQLRLKPNELGRIPILMYHAFVKDESKLDEWSITKEQFVAQLAWLHEHNFYVVPLLDVINNQISAPPGKHPVILTFDDSSSGQFRLIKDAKGALVPDPETAVGIMEAFFDAHPDFGRTALFATVSTNCFRYEGEIVSCEDRLSWLADHGYEIANHTLWHENLHTVSDEMFKEQVGGNKLWIDERVPGRANLSNVLVLPFGEWPRNEQQVLWLKNTFEYEGEEIRILGIVEVSGGPSQSPSSGEWDRRHIARFNTDPATWEMWTRIMENGEISLYTSDGNPATVTIPDPIPADLVDVYDPEWASAYNMEVIRYELPGDADTADEGATGTRRPAASSRRASPRCPNVGRTIQPSELPPNINESISAATASGGRRARRRCRVVV